MFDRTKESCLKEASRIEAAQTGLYLDRKTLKELNDKFSLSSINR